MSGGEYLHQVDDDVLVSREDSYLTLESNRSFVLHYRLPQSSDASQTKGEQLMNYECQERRADHSAPMRVPN